MGAPVLTRAHAFVGSVSTGLGLHLAVQFCAPASLRLAPRLAPPHAPAELAEGGDGARALRGNGSTAADEGGALAAEPTSPWMRGLRAVGQPCASCPPGGMFGVRSAHHC